MFEDQKLAFDPSNARRVLRREVMIFELKKNEKTNETDFFNSL
jgi:hypothetical protein